MTRSSDALDFMAKKKNTRKTTGTKSAAKNRILKSEPVVVEVPPPGGTMYAVRETIESIVIAFVLAFLFRTFEAEAFVIPTGSMSPALQGQHKDVGCTECGYRFRTTASSEGDERQQYLSMLRNPNLSFEERRQIEQRVRGTEVVLGVCPMCRQTMAMRPDLPEDAPEYINAEEIANETSYPGDRILVNKFAYTNHDPERWDVVVFKFPGNGEMNYIKRLIGLPNETLRVYQGDIFIREAGATNDFQIERKPADKVMTMLQPVHDTDYDASSLYNAGWPLRWQGDAAWQVEATPGAQTVAQTFNIAAADETAWLRYQHRVPRENDWTVVRKYAESGKLQGTTQEDWLSESRPELISDFNPYNANILRSQLFNGTWLLEPHQLGVEWVSDLAVRCEVDVKQAKGTMLLDLVEAGRHFTCRIELSTGEASFSITGAIEGASQFQPTAKTPIKKAGSYELLFANVDDQILLWVDGSLIEIEGATYGEAEIGPRDELLPRTNETDLGDLSPVGIGAEGAELSISRLEVLRDIYYIAVDHRDPKLRALWSRQVYFTDYLAPDSTKTLEDGTRLTALNHPRDLFRDPGTWQRFSTRNQRDFPIQEGQLFVMGDNSPASQDCRLWSNPSGDGSKPGGPYMDRRLMIGKAVCVFWPHSWGSIPGASALPGFPAFGDMRLVR